MKIKLFALFLITTICAAQTPCNNGFAGIFPCNKIDLLLNMPFAQIGGNMFNTEGNDCWGWTDPQTGREYALMGCSSHTAFVDITNPLAPIYKGRLPSRNNISSSWRDIKVYNNYAFIVSEAQGHGIQIFDLTKLRAAGTNQIFTADALYSGFGNCHNIAINEATGFAYCVGSNTFGGGPHVVNIQNPLNPVFSFGYNAQGYCHDAQIVIYNGPDTNYQGHEIFFGANETKMVVIDVTDKANPQFLSSFFYSNTVYTHQGWLTPNQKYWMMGDEIDEIDFGFNTKTIIVDLTSLTNPVLKNNYFGPTPAIDHNGYTLGNDFYLANYRAGLRIINMSNIDNGNLNQVGFFDTYPADNNADFNGAWSVYPYFASGNIVISDIDRGLFVVRKNASLSTETFARNNSGFGISPNPASSEVVVQSIAPLTTIKVFNILGKEVISFDKLSGNSFGFDVSSLSAGVYLINVNGINTQKLIKK